MMGAKKHFTSKAWPREELKVNAGLILKHTHTQKFPEKHKPTHNPLVCSDPLPTVCSVISLNTDDCRSSEFNLLTSVWRFLSDWRFLAGKQASLCFDDKEPEKSGLCHRKSVFKALIWFRGRTKTHRVEEQTM